MPEELEWKTRKDRVDRKLTSLHPAWAVVKYRPDLDTASLSCHAVEEYPTQSGPADYALFVKGRLLGIIEAKKVKVGPANVLEQAKRYARGASDGPGTWHGFRVPFLYSTNGEVIYFVDVRNEKNISRRIGQFHTADALEEMFGRQAGFGWFRRNPVAIEKLRPYQKKAIEAVEAALAGGRRAMLVAMATGTGKTFMTVAQIYRLLESKTVRRVLFLVDRRALAAQAVREFAAFTTPKGLKFDQEYDVFSQRFRREDFDDDKPYDPKVLPGSHLTAPQASHTFVYVSTIQRMAVNLFGWEGAFAQAAGDPDYEDEDTGRLDIPIHAFDVVIADGWLVDYDAVKINSKVRMHGAFLKEGEQVGIVDTETGREVFDQLEDEREFSSAQIEKDITAPDSNRKIVREIARCAEEHEKETGRFPKTLIFAVNDLPHTSHADQVVRICRETFGRGDDFVQKITGSPSVDRPLQRIREFRKANVIFFQKGRPIENVWIYDARSNVPGITKKERPLTPAHFADFEKSYGPDAGARRKDLGEQGRFRRFNISEIKDRDYKLDITWLKDESLEDANDLPEPQDLAAEAITELEAVVDELKEIIQLVEVGANNGTE